MTVDLRCRLVDAAGCRRVVVTGEVDMASAPELWRFLVDTLAGAPGGRVELDLRGVSFFSAAGIRVLEQAHARAHARHVELEMVEASRVVELVLGLMRTSGRLDEIR